MSFSSAHAMVVEWGDCDPPGIVFYPRFFAMFDAATAFLLEAVTGRTRATLIAECAVIGSPILDTRAVFHRPVSFDDRIVILSQVTRLGCSSLDISHMPSRGEVLCVEANETRAFSARESGSERLTARALPQWLRACLEKPGKGTGHATI